MLNLLSLLNFHARAPRISKPFSLGVVFAQLIILAQLPCKSGSPTSIPLMQTLLHCLVLCLVVLSGVRTSDVSNGRLSELGSGVLPVACPTNSTPVVCLGGKGTPSHGHQPCACPRNYACVDTNSRGNCTSDSYYCACEIESCVPVGGRCSSGPDCCSKHLPSGYEVYCGGPTPSSFKCTLKLSSCEGTVCGQGATSCCGSVCLKQDKCCDPKSAAHGRACCGSVPIAGVGVTCCSGAVVASRKCCHGVLYDPDSGRQQCCARGPCTIPPGKVSCCP